MSKILNTVYLIATVHSLKVVIYQIGFRKNFGRARVVGLYVLRSVLCRSGTMVNIITLCTVDVSKAFDKINNHGLCMKLMDRKKSCKSVFVILITGLPLELHVLL